MRQARTYLYRVASSNRLEVMAEILGPGIAEAKKQNVAAKSQNP